MEMKQWRFSEEQIVWRTRTSHLKQLVADLSLDKEALKAGAKSGRSS
jgi:hypothetical protein